MISPVDWFIICLLCWIHGEQLDNNILKWLWNILGVGAMVASWYYV